jgi:hypothetical protein
MLHVFGGEPLARMFFSAASKYAVVGLTPVGCARGSLAGLCGHSRGAEKKRMIHLAQTALFDQTLWRRR